MSIVIDVTGTPGAQGSKRHVGRGILVESSKKVKPWRSDVKAATETAIAEHGDWHTLTTPAYASISFRFRRPKAHYRTGRNAHLLREDAPAAPISRALGDVDKLVRSTFDALTAAGVVADDSLFAQLYTEKVWCDDFEVPGASIIVGDLRDRIEAAS